MSSPRIESSKAFATDEDLLVAASGDFLELVPRSNRVAHAESGSFPPSPGGSWELLCGDLDFTLQAVRPGMVCQLLRPSPPFRVPDLLVIEAAAPNRLELRRATFAAGEGQPPSPPAGLLKVEFLIASLWPQIERATYDLNRDFGLSENVRGRRFEDLCDPRELREACVSLVLSRQYLAMARLAGKEEDFTYKSRLHRDDYEAAMARASVCLRNARESRLNRQARVVR